MNNKNIDPIYLRAIREGLISGKLEKESETDLPQGIAELFDKELFPLNIPIAKKQSLLNFFTVFALFQNEVTPSFIAVILDWEEEKVSEFIYIYSKWFTTSGNNHFRLYHDRFRVYILQKNTSNKFLNFNDKLIEICHQAISAISNEEQELYALEYLSTHLFVKAMLVGDGSQLKQFSSDKTIWDRQVKASKDFEWSKKMLNETMQFASKFDEEQVIECALNKVDLYHQEQNDAPRIVQLFADGDIETGLQRIEDFGVYNQSGFRRKFILYMLCLMELTFLDSKDKKHAKKGIEKILKHVDESLTINQSDLINWNDFFPSYLVFQLLCKWDIIGVDIKHFHLIKFIDLSWIEEMSPYNLNELKLLKTIADLKVIKEKYKLFNDLAIEYVKIDKIDNAISLKDEIIENQTYNQEILLAEIIIESYSHGKIDIYNTYFENIKNDELKSTVLKFILKEKAKQDLFTEFDIELTSKEILPEIVYELINNKRFNIASNIINGFKNDNNSKYITLKMHQSLNYINNNLYDKGLNLFLETNLLIDSKLFLLEQRIEQLKKVNIQTSKFYQNANSISSEIEELLNLKKDGNGDFLKNLILQFFKNDKLNLSIELISKFSKYDSSFINEIKSIFNLNESKLINNEKDVYLSLLSNFKFRLNTFDKIFILLKLSQFSFEKEQYIISEKLINKAVEYRNENDHFLNLEFCNKLFITKLFLDYYSLTLKYENWKNEFNLFLKYLNLNKISDNESIIILDLISKCNFYKKIEIDDITFKTLIRLKEENNFNLIYNKYVKIDHLNAINFCKEIKTQKLSYSFESDPVDYKNIKSNIAIQYLRKNELDNFLYLVDDLNFLFQISIFYREKKEFNISKKILLNLCSKINGNIFENLSPLLIIKESLFYYDEKFSLQIIKCFGVEKVLNIISKNVLNSFNSIELKHNFSIFYFFIDIFLKLKFRTHLEKCLLIFKEDIFQLKLQKENLLLKSRKSEKKQFETLIIEFNGGINQLEIYLLKIKNNVLSSFEFENVKNELVYASDSSVWDIYKKFYDGPFSDFDLINIKSLLLKESKKNYYCDNKIQKLLYLYIINQTFFDFIDLKKLNNFKSIFNIQWAIDIKNQLPN